MNKPRILVSACLLGVNCRYNGERKKLEGIERLMERAELIPVCPEILGGLPTPRPPAERVGDRVMNREGMDVTEAYQRGAEETLRLAELFGAHLALLKERSPSCGMGKIYDGSFQGRIVDGSGVTAQLLAAHGIYVYGESRIDELLNEVEKNT
ncbi:MAG: DUF523 domain-containing protein [Clostridia bacterium]|nr:DUF523 domain-containing protein [Clostridia bacterium]